MAGLKEGNGVAAMVVVATAVVVLVLVSGMRECVFLTAVDG